MVPTTPSVWLEPEGLGARLLERRIVLVGGFLDAANANQAAAQVMLLDGTGDEPIELHMSCPDGDLDSASMLADTIDLVGVPVVARARGTIAGAVLAPFVAAGRRLAQRHSLFVLREPSAEFVGRATDLETLAEQHRYTHEGFVRRLAAATGRPDDKVAADLRAGKVLDATHAFDYGLVHEIV
jgi:ATP-dependent Clp protease protease subunit